MAFAEVIVDINHHHVDKIFDYSIPADLNSKVAIGKRVLVPFNNRKIVGFVMGTKQESVVNNVKEIYQVLDEEPVIAADLVELTKWIANKYFCQQVQVLKGLLPEQIKNFKSSHKIMYYYLTEDETLIKQYLEKNNKRAPVQLAIINYFLQQKSKQIAMDELRSALGQITPSLKTLTDKGVIKYTIGIADNDPYAGQEFSTKKFINPNKEQMVAIDKISVAIKNNCYSSWLLYGITGSGKTEVYLQAIAETIKLNKDAIALVPEISLTHQTVSRFKERFGNLVAVFHSRLTAKERMDQWWKIKSGQVKIVVGARSAIFAPFSNLGLIIIDEEHEASYKQEESPRYHTKQVALKRGQLTNSVVVFGSATPSLETFFEASNNQHQLLTLTERPAGIKLPQVEVVDLREELRHGNRSIFSRVLYSNILETIANREQIILFLNRRGHSTFVNCRECGYVLNCPHCAVSMTLHQVDNVLKCHYCDYTRDIPQNCPTCGSSHIRHFGIGTQKVEEEVKKNFPHARVLRMDVDTTRKKGSHQKILDLFQQGRADILIGTQMIAKGLDFPNVSLVGILAADLSLNLPDFRACERTFQLATQVAGRAGRDKVPGKVVIQTYAPQNYAIKCATEHNFDKFYPLELEQRKKFGYPPVANLIRILAVGSNADVVELNILQISQKIKQYINDGNFRSAQILGPKPAPISKLRNQYRWHILLKGVPGEILPHIKRITDYYYAQQEKVKIIVDVDPLQIM